MVSFMSLEALECPAMTQRSLLVRSTGRAAGRIAGKTKNESGANSESTGGWPGWDTRTSSIQSVIQSWRLIGSRISGGIRLIACGSRDRLRVENARAR